jgi:hypothetical protein
VTLKRKRRKPRAAGTGCQVPKCRRLMFQVVDGIRYCVKHTADRLIGNLVRARDGGVCRNCGAPPPEGSVNDWAHVHSRGKLAIRWDPDNAVTLCRRCHWYFGPTHREEWEQWCREQGIDWDGLRWRSLNEAPMDPADVIESLAAISSRLEGVESD